jgi:hypothetical protein
MPQDHSLPAIIPSNGVDTYRMSTDAAAICGAIVKATAQTIQGKKYVKVEGWQAIAIAHGCVASSRDVEVVEGGIRAIGEVRRMSDGFVIATAEGFVGDDEKTWASRPMFARRAMTQTRAISRACRSAFAHVVVMIDKSLSTTPAEEMQGVHDVDGPGSSWGPGGKDASIDQARTDGLMDNAPKVTDAKRKQFEKWTTNALGTLALTGQTTESIGKLWYEWSVKVDTLEEYAPDLHGQVTKAYNAAMDAAQAQAPNTLMAG